MKSTLENGELVIKEQTFENSKDLKKVVPDEITNFQSGGLKALGIDVNIVMQVLQDRMYTNKNICFQELPCNAMDAIVRRISSGYNNFEPEIKVIFSNKDNSITISDNGCGMSEKVVDEVYRFYGRSDKRNSADEIGMFGMGSKSVFALADEFILETEAIDDQMRCKYLVTKRGILQLSRVPATENFGTSITFAKSPNINFYDIENFLKNKFKLWSCPLNIYTVSQEGNIAKTQTISKESCKPEDILKDEIPEATIKFETEDYIFLSGQKIERQNIYVGRVPYEFYNFNRFVENIFNQRISIFIKNPNIVTISATRENVERDEKIKVLVADIEAKTKEHIEKQIDNVCKNVDINNIKNFEDIEYLWSLNYSRDIIRTKYQNLYDILAQNVHIYKNKSYYAISIFNILKRKKEYSISVTWKKGKIKNIDTIPESQDVIVLDNECGVCEKDIECIACDKRTAEGQCYLGCEKKHYLQKMFPEFVPLKLKKEINKDRFKAINNRTKKQYIFDIKNEYDMGNTFTKEKFDTIGVDIYQVSEERLAKLLEFYSNLKVITKDEYERQAILSMKYYTKDGIISIMDLKKYKTVIHGTSAYGKDEIIRKHFLVDGDIFVREVISQKGIEYLKNEGVEVLDISAFIKLRKINPKLKLKNLPDNIIFDLIDRLNSNGLKMVKSGNVFTFEKEKPSKIDKGIKP